MLPASGGLAYKSASSRLDIPLIRNLQRTLRATRSRIYGVRLLVHAGRLLGRLLGCLFRHLLAVCVGFRRSTETVINHSSMSR